MIQPMPANKRFYPAVLLALALTSADLRSASPETIDLPDGSWRGVQSFNSGLWLWSASTLYRSVDGGRSWHSLRLPECDSLLPMLSAASFVDHTSGLIDWCGRLYVTDNGGEAFRVLNSPLDDRVDTGSLRNIWAGRTVWISGGAYTSAKSNGANHATRSDGAVLEPSLFRKSGIGSWTRVPLPFRDGYRAGLPRSDLEPLVVHSEIEIAFRADDSWKMALIYRGCVDEGFFSAEGQFVAATMVGLHGWISHTSGYVLRTIDGGRTWCQVGVPRTALRKGDLPYFSEILFLDPASGAAIQQGVVYVTRDSGKTWVSRPLSEKIVSLVDARDVIWGLGRTKLFPVVAKSND